LKAAIIIGHDNKSQGASTYNKITEYEFNSYIADTVQRLHNFKVTHGIHKFMALHVFNRNLGWQSVINQLKANDISLSMELHLNSFSKAAMGTETLHLDDDIPSQDLAKFLSFRIAKHYNTKLRAEAGALALANGDRGYFNLTNVKNAGVKYAVLVEPCFVKFPTQESITFVNNPLEYANILYRALEDFYVGENKDGGVN
jgi:N-acetylmuramoyl-L-alanine amidase